MRTHRALGGTDARPADAALFVFIKERKFGVDEWERNAAELVARVRAMLAPTLQTLSQHPSPL